tara:strand:+ start:216 stop:1196 length:981 start_codon:yes stop_codon:yes gene_type:complete
MKILYGIQGTGNGHLSRGHYIYNLLQKYSKNVDVIISGENYSLIPKFPIKYRNKGITFSIINGKIDYLQTLLNLDLLTSYNQQKEIPFRDYDLIVTDFDPITAWGSLRYKIPSIHISHQASFLETNVPRPDHKNILGEYVMKYFCPTNDYIGLHYQSYGKNISEPIISNKIQNCVVESNSHVTVYLPWFEDNYLINFFKNFNNIKFHIFSKDMCQINHINNITFYPISEDFFLESIRCSSGVICNAGFQTSSEVIYLGKRLLVVPVEGQYEQICNVAALKKLGVSSIDSLDATAIDKVKLWLNSKPIKIKFTNSLNLLLEQKINNI